MANKSLEPFTRAEEKVIEKIIEKRTKVETKYPLLFIMLVTFGAIATLHGFQRIIDKIDIFANNPWILFVSGLLTLMATGTIYKKLN